MKIITDLYVYGFHLFVSYLNGGLEIIPFSDNSHSPYNSKIKYLDKIENGSNLNELQGVNHILYATQNSKLTGFDLISGNQNVLGYTPEIDKDDISQIAINHEPRRLFTFSNKQGFSEINISQKFNPKLIKHYIPEFLESLWQPVLSNMVPSNDYLLVSIRNFGVVSVPLETNKRSEYIPNKNIETADPQDAKKFKQKNVIVIADSIEGLVFYDLRSQEIFSKIPLPNNDFPQQIEIMHTNILIKGSKGIYIFNPRYNNIRVLYDGKTGAIATYYDYIFFSSRGNIFGLSVNNSFERKNFKLETQELEVKNVGFFS